MNSRLLRLILGLAVISTASVLQAQSFTGHYPAGVEGIKGATLPPPGLYLRDYNYFYFANDYPDGPPGFDLFAYVQAPRLIWISPYKILGGNYGADLFMPLIYQDVDMTGFSEDDFGLGDMVVEPITLSWHGDRWDVGVGYAFWAPTGDYDNAPGVYGGKGFWGHMLTAGATWYFDREKTWALSALNRYEFNHENSDWDITPGQAWTLEWGLSKSVRKTIDVGLVGYYQAQTTKDSGHGASEARDHVVGLGPEISMFCPKLKLFTSLRYLREFEAHDRPEGHTLTLTFTKPF